MLIEGRCHCGAVTFEAEVDDDAALTLCHCNDCQVLTGTAFRTTLSVPRAGLKIQGEPAVYIKVAESGRRRFLSHCKTCGTPMFSHGEGAGAETWGIRWGSITHRDRLRPRRQIWRRSAAPWVCEFADLETSPRE